MTQFKIKSMLMLAVGLTLALSSCKKLSVPTPAETNGNVDKFTSIKATPSFDWSTVQSVNFVVTGFQCNGNIVNTIKMTNETGAITYYTQLTAMNKDINTSLNLPKTVKSVKVSYGSIQKTVDVVNGKISFDYLPTITDTIN